MHGTYGFELNEEKIAERQKQKQHAFDVHTYTHKLNELEKGKSEFFIDRPAGRILYPCDACGERKKRKTKAQQVSLCPILKYGSTS